MALDRKRLSVGQDRYFLSTIGSKVEHGIEVV
jgi:hypothetical protein